MTAKVSKSKTKMKNQPHIKTMTKTIVKKNKNKAVGGMNVKSIKTMKKKVKSEKKGLEKKVKRVKKVLKDSKTKKEFASVCNSKELKIMKMKEDLEKQPYEEAVPLSLLLDTDGDVALEDKGGNDAIEKNEDLAQENTISIKKNKNKAVGGVNMKSVKTVKKKIKSKQKGHEKKLKKVKKVLKDSTAKIQDLEQQPYEEATLLSLLLDTDGDVELGDNGEIDAIEKNDDLAQENTISIQEDSNVNDGSHTSIDDAELTDTGHSTQKETKKGNTDKKKVSGGKKVKRVQVKIDGTDTVIIKKAKKGVKGKKKAAIKTESGRENMSTARVQKKKSKQKSIRRKQSDYEALKEKERALAIDLFGTDAGLVHADREENVVSTLTERVVNGEVKKKRKISKSEEDQDIEVHEVLATEPKRKAAWVDEDDEDIRVKDVVANMVKARGKRGERETSKKKYEVELREKFNQVYGGTPDWADLDHKPDEEEDDELIRKTGNYLSTVSSTSLPKKVLEYKTMVDLNSSHTEGAIIDSIDFNPNLQVGLVAGKVKNMTAVTLYQVDGKVNHRIHSSRFPGYALSCARFMRDGRRFVLGSSLNNHFYVYDMETSTETRILWKKKIDKVSKEHVYVSPDGKLLVLLGHCGKICLYDTATLSLVEVMQAPHFVGSATFNADGSRMYTHGDTGEVFIWDMNARECVHKFYDDGCISDGIISMSPNNQYLACGSNSGVVNVYDSADLSSFAPKPVKALYNLKTKVTSLCFNSSSELLAMASVHSPNALKLVHFPSMTVFENFPDQERVVKPVECLQFSPQSGYFAMGNRSGAAPLYRLKHFANY